MADLLECLIQIKALRETLEGLASLSGKAPPGADEREIWNRMADAERRYAGALGTATGDLSAPGDDADGARRAFAELRQANLVVLEYSMAAQLAGEIPWPGRRSTTVADLVAIMLAHDTETLGGLRRSRTAPADRLR